MLDDYIVQYLHTENDTLKAERLLLARQTAYFKKWNALEEGD